MEFRIDVRCGNSLFWRHFVLKTSINCQDRLGTNRIGKLKTQGRFLAGAILSKDAVFYLATDPLTAPILKALECDEVIGGRR